MASIVLASVGSAIGAGFGGSILGLSGAAIGGMIGSAVGTVIDASIVAALTPAQRVEGARLENLRVTTSTEGLAIPRVFGRARIGGNVIWATDFKETKKTTTQGGKGGGPKVKTTEYSYSASFAVGICEGVVAGIGRVWADGNLIDLSDVNWRWYPGDETQAADPLIAGLMGADSTPAYRGLCYAVFEDLPLEKFGNRLPQLTFEVFRPLADSDTAEGLVRAVTMIPATGEFVYATEPVRVVSGGTVVNGEYAGGGEQAVVNFNASADLSDLEVSLDRLVASCPGIESVSLVVSWFGTDLRAGECKIKPGVEVASREESRAWVVNGVARSDAHLISTDAEGRPVYGGTPADWAVVQAIQAIKARGLRVTFYPFILMDIPPGNSLPDPYSDNAATLGQAVYPWRGRITCSPAPGAAGSADQTSAAAAQVDAFFGSAQIWDFSLEPPDGVSYFGIAEPYYDPWTESWVFPDPDGDWGFRRFILHYAHLCAVAGGVDTFLIGSELRGLTTIRDDVGYPAVDQLRGLAWDVRSVLGPTTKISYAADWSEYFGHHPQDGSGDVFFHLDPLWADADIDFVGIDNYMPLSDWRDGFEHLDALGGAPAVYDRAYLQSNIEGGEGFDWFYASEADRLAQVRSPISDGAYGKPWVFRYKDLRSWWASQHFNRPGGVEESSPTEWVPESKPIRFTEFGCPAIDRGTNQPNVFVDPKSDESAVPYFSRGWRDDTIQRSYLEALLLYWSDPARNPVSSVYGGSMIDLSECAAWTWDARPHPAFPALEDLWSDGVNWRLGHWLTGRLGSVSLAALVRHLCRSCGIADDLIDVSGLWGAVEGFVIASVESPRAALEQLAVHFGFDAVESEGRLKFVMRGRGPVASIGAADLVAGEAEDFELTRGQETELPEAFKWQVARADGDYDAVVAEVRRSVSGSQRLETAQFPFVVPVEEAERRCRRALMERWAGREASAFALPPSMLALDPGDVVELQHDGRSLDLRLGSVSDRESRVVEAVRQDREAYDLAPGEPRAGRVSRLRPPAVPSALFLDLPQISTAVEPHRPWIAAWANPWPGDLAVFRSRTGQSWAYSVGILSGAQVGVLVTDLPAGPVWRWDIGNSPHVSIFEGTLSSLPDEDVLAGANALAVLGDGGEWEILQFASASLVAPGRYRLSRLLRGQRGTETAMGASAGAPVVVLDTSLVPVPLDQADLGVSWTWRVGPAAKPVSDISYSELAFVPAGRGLLSSSPVHLRLRRLASGDLELRWARRSRSLGADDWSLLEPDLPEPSEAYSVEVWAGSSVVRAASVTEPRWVYGVAEQVADFGSSVSQLEVRVAQIGARGPGIAASAVIEIGEAQ